MYRVARGISSFLSVALHPLGRLVHARLAPLSNPERRERGLVLVLPGIEGESLLNHDLALGLAEGGVDCAIELFDWTTGCFLLAPLHLRSRRLHARGVARLTERIVAYQREFPGRPLHLVGHSGGAAVALLTLEQLPPEMSVTTAVLLAVAISPHRSLDAALARTQRGLWNFSSRGDWLFVTLGTLVFGSIDGRHTICAGARGFKSRAAQSGDATRLAAERLHEVPYRFEMARSFHFAGHFGCVNRVFAAEYVAPLVRGGLLSSDESAPLGEATPR